MTPRQAAQATWEKDRRELTDSLAAALSGLLPDGTDEKAAEAA